MKNLLTLTAVAGMALGLAACGDDVKERTVVVQPTPAPAAPSTTVVTPPANNTATPPATQNNTVVVPERRP